MRSLLCVVIAGIVYSTGLRVSTDDTAKTVDGDVQVAVEITFPRNGVLTSRTFFPGFMLTVADDDFSQVYGGTAKVCFSIDDNTTVTCLALDSASSVVEDAPAGPKVMTAWVVDGMGRRLSGHSSSVHFQVASDEQMSVALIEEAQPSPFPSAESLLIWYRAQQHQQQHLDTVPQSSEGRESPPGVSGGDDTIKAQANISPLSLACRQHHRRNDALPLLLIVGAKTAIYHFHRRQAARETWMTADLGPLTGRICLQFITGSPGPEFPRETTAALLLEASMYGDILLAREELGGDTHDEEDLSSHGLFGMRDDYDNLIEKTTFFFKIVTQRFGRFRYLLMIDDDVYVRLDRLAQALDQRPAHLDVGGFYAGQVFEDEMGRPIRPRRHPSDRNTLSRDHWPLEILPRFAAGPHYILSRYCVEYIASNKEWLRGVGTLEDVSVAVWMLALQVHPVHLDHFRDNKFGCVDYAMSMANLGPPGLRAAHFNLVAGRPLCTGFDQHSWASYIPQLQ